MCVIIACKDKFPSPTMLINAEQSNRDGAGVAWINDKNEIEFIKGLEAHDVQKLIDENKISLPCIIHFRISTCGYVGKDLCHPFPISNNVELDLKGICKNGAFFHNGILIGWRDDLIKLAIGFGFKLPKGEFTDSRYLALACNYLGVNALKYLDDGGNKFAILEKDGIKLFGGHWYDIDGCKCSNTTAENYEFNEACYTEKPINALTFKASSDKLDDKNHDKYISLTDKISKLTLALIDIDRELKVKGISKRQKKKKSKRKGRIEFKLKQLSQQRSDLHKNVEIEFSEEEEEEVYESWFDKLKKQDKIHGKKSRLSKYLDDQQEEESLQELFEGDPDGYYKQWNDMRLEREGVIND